ncbi:hypothetical protein AURDEDRAFT_131411, partial [Auricularia subglabra TFB-10046 SS5]
HAAARADQARALEAQRLADEQAARERDERLAAEDAATRAEQARALEAQRLADQQAAREREERLVAEEEAAARDLYDAQERLRATQARLRATQALADEQAAREREERLAAEAAAARAEQARALEAQRLADEQAAREREERLAAEAAAARAVQAARERERRLAVQAAAARAEEARALEAQRLADEQAAREREERLAAEAAAARAEQARALEAQRLADEQAEREREERLAAERRLAAEAAEARAVQARALEAQRLADEQAAREREERLAAEAAAARAEQARALEAQRLADEQAARERDDARQLALEEEAAARDLYDAQERLRATQARRRRLQLPPRLDEDRRSGERELQGPSADEQHRPAPPQPAYTAQPQATAERQANANAHVEELLADRARIHRARVEALELAGPGRTPSPAMVPADDASTHAADPSERDVLHVTSSVPASLVAGAPSEAPQEARAQRPLAASHVSNSIAPHGYVMPLVVFVSAAGQRPQPFCITEVFVATFTPSARQRDNVMPDVGRILRAGSKLTDAFAPAARLLKHVFTTASSANVYSGTSVPPPSYVWSISATRPPGEYMAHGRVGSLLASALPPSPAAPCLAPRSWLDEFRTRAAQALGTRAPVNVVHVFIEHLLMRAPEEEVPDVADRSQQAPGGIARRATAPRELPTAVPPEAGRRRRAPLPARVLNAAQPPEAGNLEGRRAAALRTKYPDATRRIRLYQQLAHPNTRAAALAEQGNPSRALNTAIASYLAADALAETCEAMGLQVGRPTASTSVELGPRPEDTYLMSPNTVAEAFGMPLKTWETYKTRFRKVDAAVAGIRQALESRAVDDDTRASLKKLLANLSWFSPEIRRRKPQEQQDKYASEEVLWEWQTSDLTRAIAPWLPAK